MKAFDRVNRDLLLIELNYYGIQGEILDGVKSYLYNRKQRVELKSSKKQNFFSSWEIVKHGVPLGNIVGPLLFNIYVIFLCKLIHLLN